MQYPTPSDLNVENLEDLFGLAPNQSQLNTELMDSLKGISRAYPSSDDLFLTADDVFSIHTIIEEF